MFRVFVVDDESLARKNVIDALSHHREWRCTHTFQSSKDVIEEAVKHTPHVIFLDIQMPGEDGLALARQLLKLKQPPLIVFITAFSDYAVTAFELYAIDYLLKPFDDARISFTVEKLKHVLSSNDRHFTTIENQQSWAESKPLDKIVIKSSTSLRVIPTAEITWLEANGNYVDIHHAEGKHLLRGSLKNLLSHLDPDAFLQVHRSFVVRQNLIRELKTIDEERAVLILSSGDEIPVGKSYKTSLIHTLCQRSS